jgi:hypothetical protein
VGCFTIVVVFWLFVELGWDCVAPALCVSVEPVLVPVAAEPVQDKHKPIYR